MPIQAVVAEAAPAAAAPVVGAEPAKTVSFETAKAERRAAAVDAPSSATNVAKVDGGTTAPIEMSADELAKATALSREAREAKQRTKELEAGAADVAPLVKAKALVAEGKHLAAIRELGIDLNAAIAEELGTTPADETDPKLAAALKDLEAIKAAEAERVKREEAAAASAAGAARAADVTQVVEHVKAEATKYPLLARNPAWVAEAYAEAEKIVPALVEKKSGVALTAQEKHNLIIASLEEAEEEHRKKAALYGATVTLTPPGRAQPPKAGARPVTFDSSVRGGTNLPAPKVKTKVTFEEAKRERRQRA